MTREHRRLIRQNVTEHIAGNNYIELLRVAHQLHRSVIDVHMGEFHIGVLRVKLGDHVAPKLGGFEHIGLVDRAHTAITLACCLKRQLRNSADFTLAVAHGVEAFALAGLVGANATRLTKIDVAGKFTQNQDVESGNNFRAQR